MENSKIRKEVIEEISQSIGDSYSGVLETGYEEEQHRFPITMCIIEFMASLKEKDITFDLNIFDSEFIDKMYVEASKYIGK